MITGILRNLRRHPVRSGLAIGGIAVAAALLLDMVLLSGGMEISFERLVLARGYQIRVSPKGTLPFDTEATLADAGALVGSIRDDPGVARAGAILGATVFLRAADSLVPLTGYGFDPKAQGLHELRTGADLTPGDSAGLLLGEEAAHVLGLALGDTVTLEGELDPLAGMARVERRLVVRGVVRWLYDAQDQLSLGAALGTMQQLSVAGGEDRASAVLVMAAHDTLAAAVAARLAARHPDVAVNSLASLVAQFRGRLTYFRQLSIILGAISLGVAALLVATILTITVNERLGEIATLRAIGISRNTILRQVLLEGAVLTGVGGSAGMALGLLTARYLDTILTQFPGLPASVSFFVARPAPLLSAATVIAATGLLAGLIPAWLASRAPIAATLREDGG